MTLFETQITYPELTFHLKSSVLFSWRRGVGLRVAAFGT